MGSMENSQLGETSPLPNTSLPYLSNQLPHHHRSANEIVMNAKKHHQNQAKKRSDMEVEKKSFVPRQYQVELFHKALERNTIAVLETGAGKTLVAVMLIKEMVTRQRRYKELNPEAPHKVAVFLVNIVPLVFQQGELVKACIPYKVDLLCGEMKVEYWKITQWRNRIETNDVLVMTAQIFLNMLRHAFITLDEVSLLVFDECHHTQKRHPYNMIMREFYDVLPKVTETTPFARPKIFGMTASPLGSKIGAISAAGHLEAALDSYIFTANSIEELRSNVNRPHELTVGYDPPEEYSINPLITLIHEQCPSSRIIQRLYEDTLEILAQLGPWCAFLVFCNSIEELTDKSLPSDSMFLDDKFTPTAFTLELGYIKKARSIYQTYKDSLVDYRDPLEADPLTLGPGQISSKALTLLKTVHQTKRLPSFCGIIFVERRCIARALMLVIKHSKSFDFIRPGCLLGHGARQTSGSMRMNFRQQRNMISDFRDGKINLMVATSVAEEGLDIQPCNIVIRFDFCSSLVSYIQSRGRARQKKSAYILLQENGNISEQSFLTQMQRAEQEMINWCNQLPEDRFRSTVDLEKLYYAVTDMEADPSLTQSHIYRVPKTGATITLDSSIELLHRFCSVLPQDNFCDLKPHFKVTRVGTHYQCILTLPPNCPLKVVNGDFTRSKVGACQSCAFKACVVFHLSGAIDDNLLPPQDAIDVNDYDPVRNYHSNGTVEGSWLAMNEYYSKSPDFWIDDGMGWQEFYFNIIDISNINLLESGATYRTLAIITRRPLPKFNPIEVFIKGEPVKVNVILCSNPLRKLSSEKQQGLFEFTRNAFFALFHRKVICDFNNIMYLMAPIVNNTPGTSLTASTFKIDWDAIHRSTNKSPSTDMTQIDSIICDLTDNNHRYRVLAVHEDLTPNSLIPDPIENSMENDRPDRGPAMTFCEFYQNRLKKTVKDFKQPVLEVQRITTVLNYLCSNGNGGAKKSRGRRAAYLLPEFCRPYMFDAPTLRSLMLVPSLMMRVDALLLIKEVKIKTDLPEVEDELLLEAFTCSTANVAMDYERLELLGDSFLKFIASLDVFIHFPLKHEGQLHCQRVRIIGNRTMYHAAKERNFPAYFITQPFNRRTWRPPNVKFDNDALNSAENAFRVHKRALADKSLADVVEASLGASLLSGGNCIALKCAVSFGIPLKKTLKWEELSSMAPSPPLDADEAVQQSILDVTTIEEKIGYKFRNQSLLVEAFTHASYPNAITPSYQRLEFLGDAILDHFVVSYLFHKYPGVSPGGLTEMKDACVSNNTLAAIMEPTGLHSHILHFSTKLLHAMDEFINIMAELRKAWEAKQDKSGGKEYWFDVDAPKVVSDILESIIGAVYVDSGFSLETAHSLFRRLVQPLYDQHIAPYKVIVHPSVQLTRFVHRYGCQKLKFETDTLDADRAALVDPELRASCTVTLHGVPLGRATGVVVKAARKYACQAVVDQIRLNLQLLDPICTCPTRRSATTLDEEDDDEEEL